MDFISSVDNMETIVAFGQKLTSRLSLRSRTDFFPVGKLYGLPMTSFPGKPGNHVRLKAISTLRYEDQESFRKFKKLPASEWTQRFHSVSIDVLEIEAVRREIDSLKPKVWNKSMSCQGIERILNMYLLVSLGLEHHFENEIFETLKEDSKKIEEMMASEEDLYTVSIIFWVFRTYGHYISSDVFRRFKGNNGNFKESFKGDAKGILSLYEAANLRTTKDYILDEALSFASCHLESLAASGTCSPLLTKRIRNALCLSQNWNMDMLVAVEFIPYYEQEKDHDEMLLKFAKLSFNLLQLQYLQELKIVTKWYKEVDFSSKLPPFFRDRIIENHFFVQTVFFQPQHSRERIMLIQYFTLLGLQDDTLDRYASHPEAESLVNSLDRWAPDHAMDKQPDYLKFVFKFILDTFEGFEKELSPEGKTYIVKATIEEYKTLVKANFELEKWALAAHVPSFEKYMEVAGVGVASIGTLAGTLMCMGNMVTMEAYEWLKSRPKLIQAICIKGRLVNDMTGFKEDMSRGYAANAVTCYMKQYGVTEQEALSELKIMVADADKIFLHEFLTTTGVSRLVLRAAMGVAVMLAITYNGYEGYTHPEGKIKEYMTSIFVDQIHLEDFEKKF